jgi:autotransporter-associated beta strand protein
MAYWLFPIARPPRTGRPTAPVPERTSLNTDSGRTIFTGNSTAGRALINNNDNTFGGGTTFRDQSTAGFAIIANNNSLGGGTTFRDQSNAGNASIFNFEFGLTIFQNQSKAASSKIQNNEVGATFFTDQSSADSAQIENTFGGFTQFNSTSTAASAMILNENGGGVEFRGQATAGTSTITNNCGGRTVFNNASGAGAATLINACSQPLVIDDLSTGARIIFNDQSTGGGARIINSVGGIVDISGLTTTGMSAGSIEGAGIFFLGSKALTVGGNNLSTEVTGVIADGGAFFGTGGSLIKVGSGALTLSGFNTYTGATTVNGGALIVNGSIAASSLLEVNAGAFVGGTGTLPTTQINNGGTISPGNSIGTLAVAGNLSFAPGSFYVVEVSPTSSDRIVVNGTATLAGTVLSSFRIASGFQKSYTIIAAAGGVNGTFDALATTGLPSFLTASLGYTPNLVNLNLTLGLALLPGLNGNQAQVAAAIDKSFNAGNSITGGFASLLALPTPSLAAGLTQISGEAATGAQQSAFRLSDQFLGLMLDPFVDGRSGTRGADRPALGFAPEREALPDDIALAYAKVLKAPPMPVPTFEQRWTAWGGAFGGGTRISGDPAVVGSHDLSARTAGFAGGLDYHPSRDSVVGFALAGGGTNWGLTQGLGGGKSDAFQAGVYGAVRSGPAYLAAAFDFTNHWMSTDRVALCQRPSHRQLQCAVARWAPRKRLPLRVCARRRHALRRDPGPELPYAVLQRSRHQRRRICAVLQRTHRD